MNTQKMMDIHEQSVTEFNASLENPTKPGKLQTLINENAPALKKALVIGGTIGLAIAPNIISPPAVYAQMTQQEIARELATARQEITRLERQINQRQPQINQLQQQQTAFSNNPENIRTAQEALRIAIQNEINGNALTVWQSTHNPNFRSFSNVQTRRNEINRRRDLAEPIHLRNIRGVLDNSLPNMIINTAGGREMRFENCSPAWNQAGNAAWERYANQPQHVREERADRAAVAAMRDAGRMTDIVDMRVIEVLCRELARQIATLQNPQNADRNRLAELQSIERQLIGMQTAGRTR